MGFISENINRMVSRGEHTSAAAPESTLDLLGHSESYGALSSVNTGKSPKVDMERGEEDQLDPWVDTSVHGRREAALPATALCLYGGLTFSAGRWGVDTCGWLSLDVALVGVAVFLIGGQVLGAILRCVSLRLFEESHNWTGYCYTALIPLSERLFVVWNLGSTPKISALIPHLGDGVVCNAIIVDAGGEFLRVEQRDYEEIDLVKFARDTSPERRVGGGAGNFSMYVTVKAIEPYVKLLGSLVFCTWWSDYSVFFAHLFSYVVGWWTDSEFAVTWLVVLFACLLTSLETVIIGMVASFFGARLFGLIAWSALQRSLGGGSALPPTDVGYPHCEGDRISHVFVPKPSNHYTVPDVKEGTTMRRWS